jgi:predicted DNA-binding transcriptional regulator AlpA
MARRDEVTSRRLKSAGRENRRRRGPPPTPTHCFDIPSFAAAFGFSEAFFYKLVSQGQGPRLMKIGRRTFITFEAADEWQRQREAATAAE